ncbi:MFS transporter [Spongisporangium articulatum]|uniref:MFS transporter n=1 Tax=Spongisporangium articulatum TaxID=3362603 RepID=A0ABW8AQE2_9ACTN
MRSTAPVAAHATGHRWWVLLAGLLSLVAACTFQYGLPFLVPTLRASGLSLTEVAWLVSAPVVGILAALIAWGAVTDRYGERWVLAGGLAGAAVLLVVAAQQARAGHTLALGVALAAAGASAAAVQVASGRLILGWFAAHERGLAMGLRQTAQPLGVGLAAVTVPYLSPVADREHGVARSMVLMAALCAVAAVVIAALARDPQLPDSAEVGRSGRAGNPYASSYLPRIHLASALLVIPQFGVAAFAYDYLVTVRGLDAGVAGAVLALAQAGGAFSRLGAGWWSDRVGARLGPMRSLALVIATTVLATGLFAALPAPETPTVVVVVLAAVFSVSTNGLAFTAVAERAGRAWAGRALGVQNTGQNGVAVLTAPVLAGLISALGNRAGYPAAFLALTVPSLVAAAIIPARSERRA